MKAKGTSDELIADSLQIENYMSQKGCCTKCIFKEDLEAQLGNYLQRYQRAPAQTQFKIFLFSSCYAKKIENFLIGLRGEQYA